MRSFLSQNHHTPRPPLPQARITEAMTMDLAYTLPSLPAESSRAREATPPPNPTPWFLTVAAHGSHRESLETHGRRPTPSDSASFVWATASASGRMHLPRGLSRAAGVENHSLVQPPTHRCHDRSPLSQVKSPPQAAITTIQIMP